MASECKRSGQITQTSYTHSANANYSEAYDLLIQRVKLYRRCFARNGKLKTLAEAEGKSLQKSSKLS